jgi:hypothetical protein
LDSASRVLAPEGAAQLHVRRSTRVALSRSHSSLASTANPAMEFVDATHSAMSSFHWSTMIFRFVIASKIVLLSFANHFGGNLPALTSPLYLFNQVLLVYPSRTFSISHIFLAFAMEVSPLCMIYIFFSCYSSLASTIGCPLIPGGRYTHLAWLRTASDTVSSLGTDP